MAMSASVVLAVMLLGPAVPADMMQTTGKTAATTIPDTAAGRGLTEFIDSFNAGGDKRKVWVEGRTTMNKESGAGILQQDAAFLEEHGKMTVVRVPKATATTIEAVVRHEKTGAHGYLLLEVEPAAPNKITNMQLRAATEDEIKGGGLAPLLPGIAAGLLSGPLSVWFASARNTRQNRRGRIC